MKPEHIRRIGKDNGVKELDLFVSFLSQRFPNESERIESYFTEWAERFVKGNPEKNMDSISLAIYEKCKNEL